jgi:hypothetical protein
MDLNPQKPDRLNRREVSIKLSLVIVRDSAAANDDLAIATDRAPCKADARRDSPLPAISVEFVTPAVGDSLPLPPTIKPFDVTILELSSN